MRSDNDGYDEGFDPFREEFPEHPIQHVSEAIPKDMLRSWTEGDPPQPQPKQVKCGFCHKDFMAKAAWFNGKWLFGSLCSDCGDGNKLPPGFLAECKRPPVRQMYCPNCGINRGVEARLRFNLWSYELTCPHCGHHAVKHCRIQRACIDCGEDFFVNENRPIKQCANCAKKKSPTSPYT